MSAIDAAIVKYSSLIPSDRVQQVRADAMRLLLDVATGACDESSGWFGRLGDCKRKRLGKELRHQGEHLAENVASWKVGKVVGGAIAAYAASKGYDSHAVKLLSETAVQATTATLLSMRDKKSRSPEKVATKLIAESAAALMGKLAHGGFEDAAESFGQSEQFASIGALVSGKTAGIGTNVGAMRSGIANKLAKSIVRNRTDSASDDAFGELGLTKAQTFTCVAIGCAIALRSNRKDGLRLDKRGAIAEIQKSEGATAAPARGKAKGFSSGEKCKKPWKGTKGKCYREGSEKPKGAGEKAPASPAEKPKTEPISPDRVNEIGGKIAQAFKAKGINPDEAAVRRAIDNHPKLKDLPDESKAVLAKAEIGKPEAKPAKPKRESSKDVIARGDALMPDELKGAIEKARPIFDRQEKLKGMLDRAQEAMNQGKKPTEQQRANMGKALDEYRKLKGSKELKALENEMKVFRERLIDDSPASDKDAASFAKSLKFDSNISAVDQNAVRETAREYYKLMGGAGTGTIKEFKRTDDRASARPWENSVNVGAKSQDKAVMMHEMAHHFEYADKEIGAASLDFIQSRATTKDPKKLSEITGNLRYRDNEIAYEDSWVSPYIGKVYRNGDKIVPATEVVSVGVEHFADPKAMMKLATKDPEHFKLVLGMMRK